MSTDPKGFRPAQPAPIRRPDGDPAQALHDAAVLWVLDGEYARVVDAAVSCLVADVGGEHVAILAGTSPSDNYSERLARVELALDELDLPPLPESPAELAAEGAGILTRFQLRGELTDSALNTWVTGSLTCEVREQVETALEDSRRQ